MTSKETYIMSHYTEITEAKQKDVRRMQAEVARGVLRGLISALINLLKPVPFFGAGQSSEKV